MRIDSNRQIPPTQWPLIVLFILISICVILAGIIYYKNQKQVTLNEKQLELSAITDLKIRQITQWRLERIGDGEFLGGNILMVRKFSEFLKKPEDMTLKGLIFQSLKSLTQNYDYKNILLLDHNGKVGLSFPDQDSLIGDQLMPLLPEILKKHKIVLSDLHRASTGQLCTSRSDCSSD